MQSTNLRLRALGELMIFATTAFLISTGDQVRVVIGATVGITAALSLVSSWTSWPGTSDKQSIQQRITVWLTLLAGVMGVTFSVATLALTH